MDVAFLFVQFTHRNPYQAVKSIFRAQKSYFFVEEKVIAAKIPLKAYIIIESP